MEDDVIKAVFVVCHGFRDNGDGMKCRVASVSYAFGQSMYTYITDSSYRTVLDPTLK